MKSEKEETIRMSGATGWPVVDKLICPHCQYDGTGPSADKEGFRYLEDIQNVRNVVGFGRTIDGVVDFTLGGTQRTERRSAAGVGSYKPEDLIVESHYGEGYDDGHNGRFECGNCLGEFMLDENINLHFI